MAKEYKAFISYRHLPTDSRIAERIHRGVEHYRIPRKLDPEGKRRFGRVFRDKEELPLAVNLTGSIHEALDHAEFLIVICSPETPKSQWVREEIRYFLQNHDLDHVMAVLVEGEPYEAYPPELLHRYAPDGVTVLENVEPIAADVRGSSRQEVERKIPREFLRIYARMLGCDFDDLYRREQRYRARRAVAAAVTVALVSALFIGMLLNRNAQIQRQMLSAQENESRALAALSLSAYRDGDYRGALNKALDALPGRTGQRPYVPEAEYALCEELDLLGWDALNYVQSLDLNTGVYDCRVSARRNMLVTLDRGHCVHACDLATGKELWSWQAGEKAYSPCLREDLGLLLLKDDGVTALALDSGELRWQVKDVSVQSSLSDGTLALCFDCYTDEDGALKDAARTLNLQNGRLGRRYPSVDPVFVEEAAVSPDGRYAAILQEDSANHVVLLDLESGRQRRLEGEYPEGFPNCYYEMHFSPGGDLVMGCAAAFTVAEELGRTGFVVCYDRGADWAIRFETDLALNNDTVLVNGGYSYLPELQAFACSDFGLVIGGEQELFLIDYESGQILWEKKLPAVICDVCVYESSLGIALSDGTLTFCTSGGLLGLDYGLYSFQADYGLYTARISGERFLESVFVLVPAEERRRVAVVGAKRPENVTEILPAEELGEQGVLFSPDGRWLASLDSDGESGGLCGTVRDLRGEEENVCFFCLKDFPYYNVHRDACQLMNDGRILTAFGVIDPRTEEIRGLTCSGELPDLFLSSRSAASVQRADGTTLAGNADKDGEGLWHLLLWQDGEQTADVPIPEELGYAPCCTAMGGMGCALVSADQSSREAQDSWICVPEEKRWVPLGELLDGQVSACALADSHLWLAAAEGDGSITLLDLQEQKKLRSWEYELSADAIEKLLFAREDQLLLVFSSEGDLSVFDTATGEKLGYAYYGDRLLRFHAEARYCFYEIEEQERFLIVYTDERYSEGAGLLLDRRSWLPVGVYSGTESYDPQTGELILLPDAGPLYRSKLPSLEELTERAEAVLVDNGRLPAGKDEG